MESIKEDSYRSFGALGVSEKAIIVTKLSGLALKGFFFDYLNLAIDLFEPERLVERSKRLHGDAEDILIGHNVEPDYADRFF